MSLEVHILEKRFGRRRGKIKNKTVDEIFYISTGVHTVHWLRTVQVFTQCTGSILYRCSHSALVQYCTGVNIQYTGWILYRCLHIMHWFNTVKRVSITDKQMSTSVYHWPTLSEGSVYHWPTLLERSVYHWPTLSTGMPDKAVSPGWPSGLEMTITLTGGCLKSACENCTNWCCHFNQVYKFRPRSIFKARAYAKERYNELLLTLVSTEQVLLPHKILAGSTLILHMLSDSLVSQAYYHHEMYLML